MKIDLRLSSIHNSSFDRPKHVQRDIEMVSKLSTSGFLDLDTGWLLEKTAVSIPGFKKAAKIYHVHTS